MRPEAHSRRDAQADKAFGGGIERMREWLVSHMESRTFHGSPYDEDTKPLRMWMKSRYKLFPLRC